MSEGVSCFVQSQSSCALLRPPDANDGVADRSALQGLRRSAISCGLGGCWVDDGEEIWESGLRPLASLAHPHSPHCRYHLTCEQHCHNRDCPHTNRKYGGALKPLRAVELGGAAIAGAIERSGVEGSAFDEILFGHVLQAGEGQITARQAAVAGGLPMTIPSMTVNKVCLSGMSAIGLADRAVKTGDAKFVLTGGMESMSNAPHVVREARWGARIGDVNMIDVMQHDGLFAPSTTAPWASPQTTRTKNWVSAEANRTSGLQ